MTTDVLSRSAREPDHVLRYGPGPSRVADLYAPPGTVQGLVIALHGGFWRARYDRVHLRPLAEAIAAGGHAVALIEYHRTGEEGGGHPGTFDDVELALRTVPGLVGEVLGHDFRTSDTILIGHSAGGHLALWSQSVPEARVAHVISLAGVSDLAGAERLRLSDDAVGELLHRGRPGFGERLLAADPMRSEPLPEHTGIAVTLVHGTADEDVPVAFSRSYAARDPRIDLRELPGVGHLEPIDPEHPAGALVLRLVAGDSTTPAPV